MTKYREILRLKSLRCSERNIALSCSVPRNTVSKVLRKADKLKLSWPLSEDITEEILGKTLFPKETSATNKQLPDYNHIRKEFQRNGVTKKLLWVEYCENCRLSGKRPLMYSQFCYYLQQEEQQRRATMHIPRKPGEQVEVDWAGDPACISDPDTGVITNAYIFVGVMSYSQYTYVEAFINEQQKAWITAHIHMYEYFGGVAKILVPDNCTTAVNLKKSNWHTKELNTTYQALAEHYGTIILPARVRKPKDKPNVESAVKNISTWITAALRNEQFFSLAELNNVIKEKLKKFNANQFQKKEGSRLSLFLEEELPLLANLPATRFESADWKQATVQFNYHIIIDKMFYSVPYQYIKNKIDVRITEQIIEIFHHQNRISSNSRLYGRSGQYSTIIEHMPENHKKYLGWNGERFRKWADKIGENTKKVIDSLLSSNNIEQQSYRSCLGILKLSDTYSPMLLEKACKQALSYCSLPGYKSIKNILITINDCTPAEPNTKQAFCQYGITRGAKHYGGNRND